MLESNLNTPPRAKSKNKSVRLSPYTTRRNGTLTKSKSQTILMNSPRGTHVDLKRLNLNALEHFKGTDETIHESLYRDGV